MRKFILKLMLFSIPFALMFIGLEVFYRYIPNNYSVKNQQINNQSKKTETLFLGDSHCLYGLNPKYFSKKAFNFQK